MKNELILIGGGGHCRSCIDVIEQQGVYSIAGIVDLEEKRGDFVLGYGIIASDADLPRLFRQYRAFLITLGQIKSCERRKQLFQLILQEGCDLPAIVSPLAYVSRHAQVGRGTIVMHHALVNAGAVIGDNCIINSKALIEHDAVVGDHCHVATAGIVNGGVVVGSETFFGSGAVARECVRIEDSSIIGCNVSVKKDIGPISTGK